MRKKTIIRAASIIGAVAIIGCGWLLCNNDQQVVVPVGVSYRFDSFRVDQEMTSVKGDFSQQEWHASKHGYSQRSVDNKLSKSGTSNAHTSKIDTKVAVDSSFSISSIVAGGLVALDPHVRVGVDRTGELVKEKSSSQHVDGSTEIVRTESEDADSRYEKHIKGMLGDYYLHFTLTLRNNDPDDVYVVKTNGRNARVIVCSVGLDPAFEISALIPDIDGCEVRCGEKVIPVSVKISSMQHLDQLLECQKSGGLRDKLCGTIVPQDFPLLSVRDGRNILEVMAENEIRVPTTEIALEFGDAGRLSPWRVRRYRDPYFMSFGSREPISLGDALKGINAKISSSGAFSAGTFRISGSGDLKSVSGLKLGELDCDKGVMLGVEFDGEMRYDTVLREDLEEDVGNYKRIRFVKVDVQTIVSNLCQGAHVDFRQKSALIKILEGRQNNVPGSQILIGKILVTSHDLSERQRGFDLLGQLAVKGNKDAFLALLDAYVRSDGSFEHIDVVSKCLHEMRESAWAAENYELAAKCLARFLADGKDDEFLDVAQAGFPQVDSRRESLLMAIVASQRESLLQRYLSLKLVDVNLVSADGLTAMKMAVMKGNFGACRMLCEAGANVDKLVNGQSYLDLAVGDDKKNEIVKLLINKGNAFRNGIVNGERLMGIACEARAYKNIEELINNGADIGVLPFQAAARGDLEMVNWFINTKNVGVNAVDQKFGTLLIAAGACGKVEVCKFLLKNGADATLVPDESYPSAFELAWQGGHEDVVRLLHKSAFVVADTNRLMRTLVADRTAPMLGRFLRESKGIFSVPKDYLMASLRFDCPESFSVCRKQLGMSPNALLDGLPLLYNAAKCNSAKIAKALINEGVDVNGRFRSDSVLPIEYAAKCGSGDVIKVLVEQGNSLIGNAPYHSLVRKDFSTVGYFWSLKRHGAWLVPMDYDAGRGTLLTYAAGEGNIQSVRFLLDRGFDVNSVDKDNWTPLERAILNDRVEMVRYLVEIAHAGIGDAPSVAARRGKIDIVRYFVDERAIGVHYAAARSYMFAQAAYFGQKEICRYLVARGAKVDFSPKREDGDRYYSAMEMAVRAKNEGMMKFLGELRGSDVIDIPVKIQARGGAAYPIRNDYVLQVTNTGGSKIVITITRNGMVDKDFALDGYKTNEYGAWELDRYFHPGDSGEISVSGFARKIYYQFSDGVNVKWKYGD